MVRLACTCWLANRGLSLKSWRHVNSRADHAIPPSDPQAITFVIWAIITGSVFKSIYDKFAHNIEVSHSMCSLAITCRNGTISDCHGDQWIGNTQCSCKRTPTVNVSRSFEWQTAISQSARADETYHSFDHQFSPLGQNHFLSASSIAPGWSCTSKTEKKCSKPWRCNVCTRLNGKNSAQSVCLSWPSFYYYLSAVNSGFACCCFQTTFFLRATCGWRGMNDAKEDMISSENSQPQPLLYSSLFFKTLAATNTNVQCFLVY